MNDKTISLYRNEQEREAAHEVDYRDQRKGRIHGITIDTYARCKGCDFKRSLVVHVVDADEGLLAWECHHCGTIHTGTVDVYWSEPLHSEYQRVLEYIRFRDMTPQQQADERLADQMERRLVPVFEHTSPDKWRHMTEDERVESTKFLTECLLWFQDQLEKVGRELPQ